MMMMVDDISLPIAAFGQKVRQKYPCKQQLMRKLISPHVCVLSVG